MNAEAKGLEMSARLLERASNARRAIRWSQIIGYNVILDVIARIVNPDEPEDYDHSPETFEADVLEHFGDFEYPYDLSSLTAALKKTFDASFAERGTRSAVNSSRLHVAARNCTLTLARELAKVFEWHDIAAVEGEFDALQAFETELSAFVSQLSEQEVRVLIDANDATRIGPNERVRAQSAVIRLLEEQLA